MEPRHAGDHPVIDGAVDAAAESLSPAAQVGVPPDGARRVRGDLLERRKGVDGPGVAGERDELEQRLVQAAQRRAGPEGRPDLPPERPIPAQGGRDRDARKG